MDKKFVLSIAAMAALTLVSCSSDDLDSFSDNSSKNEAISFDGYLGRSAVAVNGSRGSVETVTNLQTDGFGVFGKYDAEDGKTTDANFFKNQKVTYSNKKWTYSPLKFWPTQGHIDFLAYAPYVNGTELTGSKINFNVADNAADQTDLLWTNATGSTSANLASTKEMVKFQFHHALSRLGYTVKLYGDNPSANLANNVTFTVNKITLAGSPDGKTKAFYKTGTIDLSKANNVEGLWSAETSDNNKQNYDLVSSDQTLDQNGINSDKNYLFVIPQDFSGADELYVYVEYTIDYGGETGSVKNTVYKQIKKKFEQGKAYMLNLTLGRPIEFDVDVTGSADAGVDGWGTDDGINIGSNDKPWDRK